MDRLGIRQVNRDNGNSRKESARKDIGFQICLSNRLSRLQDDDITVQFWFMYRNLLVGDHCQSVFVLKINKMAPSWYSNTQSI